jgi:hypothetical protein
LSATDLASSIVFSCPQMRVGVHRSRHRFSHFTRSSLASFFRGLNTLGVGGNLFS